MIARRHWRGIPIAFHSSKDYKALIRTKEYNALINRCTVTDSVFAPRNVKIETRECNDQENGLGQNGLGHKIFSCGIILRIAAFLRESRYARYALVYRDGRTRSGSALTADKSRQPPPQAAVFHGQTPPSGTTASGSYIGLRPRWERYSTMSRTSQDKAPASDGSGQTASSAASGPVPAYFRASVR